ncbi:MAG TPA: DUF2961 domain-containing protein [Roseiflexaceae bacterium]
MDQRLQPTAVSTPDATTISGATAVSAQAATTDTPVPPARKQPPPLYLGLDAYRHWDKLAYLEIGDRVWGQSTADPAGGNDDNVHVLRALPDGQNVLLDQLGPGIVTFMRMQQDYGGPWSLYLDGARAATVAATDLGQTNPAGDPASAFPYPLSLQTSQSQGSSIVAAAIPFQRSIMWAAAGRNGNFYALYRKLPYGTPLPAWSSGAAIDDVVGMLRQVGDDIAPRDISSRRGAVDLAGGTATPIATLPGPSQIRAITFRVPDAGKVRFGNARLRIYWDGETSPSVDAPIKFLAGDGAGVYQPADRPLVRGWLATAAGDGGTFMDFNLYWPMPFSVSARIEIATDAPIEEVVWRIRYEPFAAAPGWWGTFHATYTSVPTPAPGQDMTFLDVTGSGKIVGTVVNFGTTDSTLEGDPHIYIDDSRTPQIQVTGTEEWGLGGEYWNGGVQTSLPLGGLPSSTNNPPGADRDGAALYRFLIADSVPFNRRVVVRWEHGGANESTHAYRAAIFWYGARAQTALLTDDLLPADIPSSSAHHYQSPGASRYQLTAAYEYSVQSQLSTMAGVTLTTASSFTLALDPRNVGAFLRRTFDYCLPNQRADIYVDGQFAGTWYSAGAPGRVDAAGHRRCWREEEFPLSATLTSGKSSVGVRVAFVPTADPPNRAWTEFRYQMYSFVMPSVTQS